MDVDSAHDHVATVAVVGAGFSGTMTAVQLARRARERGAALRIVLIEPSGKFGSGVAYGTRCTRHVLNVPAGNMSALPEHPTHFVEWTRSHGISDSPDAFVPRYWYGVYLHDLLEEARHEAHVERVAARVVDIVPEENESIDGDGVGARVGARLVFDDGKTLFADRVVLAGGNFPPSDAQLAESGLLPSDRYMRDPWKARALARVGADEDVLLVGTGLTMLDVVVQLRSSGHRGRIHSVSRRGLFPQPHRRPNTHVAFPMPPEVENAPRTAIGLLRGFRAAVRRLKQQGIDWRDVVASLRSRTVELWNALDLPERARFLRHVRPFWETHRHRIPPDVADEVQRLRDDGTLVVHRGRIVQSREVGAGLVVTVRPRDGSADRELAVGWVVNCTGPDSDVRRVDEPLWRRLLDRGVARADELALGVVTTASGALVGNGGRASKSVLLVGPLRKAQLWESTAVPELRVQTAEVAKTILASLPSEALAASEQFDEAGDAEAGPETEDDSFVPVYAGEHI